MLQKSKTTLRKQFGKSLFLPLLAFTLVFASCKSDKKKDKQEIEIMEHDELSEKERQTTTPGQTERKVQTEKPIHTPSSFPITSIDQAPIFPGCEDYKSNAVDCLSEHVGKFVEKNFNKGIAGEEGLTGTQNIVVSFEINEEGKVQNVQSRANNSRLENEAKRVISKLPVMKPGLLKGKAVAVQYTVPIKFEVK